MSLLYWLPMLGTLENQGLSDAQPVNYGATVGTAGKLGKCMQLGTASGEIIIPHQDLLTYSGPFSVSFWVNIISNPVNYSTVFAVTGANASWPQEFICFQRNGANSSYTFVVSNGSSSTQNNLLTDALALNTWYHFTLVQDSNKKMYIYQNGALLRDYSTTIAPNFAQTQNFKIGKSHTGYQGNFLINDFRFYTEALPPRDIKEISKGLVLHYPLNRGGLGPSNLIKNGFGELGSENWTSSTNISTTDIPSGQSDIKASFSGGYTIEHIKIYSTHNYKFSTWIKATATSGNAYPSLYPYDVDGKFINHFNCPAGFNLNTMTTLKQELKSGDTKIYVNDLSQWNANSGHYYNWAAIFGYKDSTGRTYPDGTYTQNCVRFGNSTNEKTNLDKTNNIITLTSAYTGPTMPIGTKLCASTEGSTYYYPLGGINLSTIQDWTYKEGIFSGNDARLRYAKTVTFWTYNNNRMAGIKIVDLTYEDMDSTIEYDCSGYCNNGTSIGTLTYSGDTPRYQVSTVFNGTDNGILIENLPLSNILNTAVTYSFWIKPSGENGGRSVYFGSYSSISWSIEKNAGNVIRGYWNGSPDVAYSGATITDNVWQHVCITKNGTSDVKVYINGVLKATSTATHSALTFPTTYRIGRDVRSNDGTPYKGLMSDFRIYATALSADDILELYQVGASLANNGVLMAHEFIE